MTEPENFEEDLFADLYEDNDPSKAPPPPKAPAPVVTESHPVQNSANDQPPISYEQDGGDETMNQDQDDDDDDVDFNLGGGGMSNSMNNHAVHMEDVPTPPSYGAVHKASAKEDGKMFIGGLNWETTDQSLRDYFSQFGEVVECTVMRDNSTGRSRGFGFLTFKDAKTVNIVMVKEHFLDGKIIDPKRAIPRDEQEKTSKIFVGGVSQETTDQEFKDYFAQFGRVVDATLMMDKDTGRPRGFGFVTFESEAGVDACINVPLEIHGKPIEVKKAQPRGNLREEEEALRRNKFRKGDEQPAQGSMGQQMGNTNGMTPQVMAQYFQRMQQYFAVMQSQMAMSRGMPMNPAMWQNMQMQQMQQMMGRGGGAGGANGQNMMNNMTPQMMQQMQQQMQQQMMQQQGQQGDQGNAGGGGGRGYNNNYDQYQQQQQQQPQGRRGGRGGGYGGGQGAYGMGGGAGGGGGGGSASGSASGAPTSWEGMYDDVPQPNPNQGPGSFRGSAQGSPDPQHAPPANAPTGPKNAGKPGANYRGGGRGGSRGFHPYSR
ncbi:hypothetical protein AK830_g9543 [Neonectria ditissima]|uniref:RRM domain-containing protein n=1 Tax=Neonectria ditissima TaxID=78410 RepID=A0A0P7B9I8_9HYPO|nr:hypothetical protein AK830_g9543 [Neonectria ditissima]